MTSVRFGVGEDTKKMMESLDKSKVQELQAGGFTRDFATAWQQVYSNELVRNPSNQAAAARLEFVKRFLDLTK